jgi:predicted TIM-barrel fold metal-dependent hydrolase
MRRLAALIEAHPGKFIQCGSFDPRLGEPGLEQFEAQVEKYQLKGVKLYTAEWRGESKGWKLHDPWAMRYLEKCQELGVKNIHVHKGPTIWPLSKDSFDVADVDDAATAFPELNFIVEHVGLPRLDDFCWIADQEPNVYGGMAVMAAFIHTRPKYFANMLGELLYWLGEDRILYGTDYAIWQPKWIIEKFVDFEMPEDLLSDFSQVTPDIKRKILGYNAARLYDLPVPEELRPKTDSGTGPELTEKPAVTTPVAR